MYPTGELSRLARHKALVCQRISRRRDELAAAATEAMRPLTWLDRAVALWQQIKPLAKIAAIPLAMLAKKVFFPRFRIFSSLLRWGPAIFGAVRMATAMRR